ncbi:DUF2568 domain-containing protein [Nakamurella aerolata]|uniref:DUF2568 domain-containing protein n=1 Tax=Nakamurella aerolata TaxID=1656892 RepID=A0A849AED7_9ACTN|nr:DUF2568 domain-containing protein [Nakamurella aerolata]NNG37548.1 DUF2568 domain-containing protein [Nakamurella aerolata]
MQATAGSEWGFNVNDVVAFLVELAALTLLGTWAWRAVHGPTPVRVLAVVVVIGAALTLWSLFAAPKATFAIPAAAVAVKALVLGGSVLAAATMLPALVVIGWGAVVVLNTTLIYVGPFARA